MSQPKIIKENHPLRGYTWWKVGGEAEYFAAPHKLEELEEVLYWAKEKNIKTTIISGGTNILISDKGIRGLVIGMSNLSGTEAEEKDGVLYLTSWAGSNKAEALKHLIKYKLDPAVFLTGLPGDMGGGVVMNAGVGEQRVPREFCEITDWVEVLRWGDDGQGNELKVIRIPANEIKWTYRHSEGWQPGIIVKVGLKWPIEPNPNLMQEMREATRKRLQSQPLDKPSCGSVFRNPEGHKSAKLIDECGLKGFTIGGAQVSQKHANFIINANEAKASDVDQLIKHVKSTIEKEKGISLKPEVVYLGEW